MYTLHIFELTYGSKDLSYIRKSLFLVYQDLPWEKIVALGFPISLSSHTRIETCRCWLTVSEYKDNSFSSASKFWFILKGNKTSKKNITLVYMYMDFIFTLCLLPVIFQQSGKKESASKLHNKFCKEKANTDCTLNSDKWTLCQVELCPINCTAVSEPNAMQISVLLLYYLLLVRWKHVLLGAICREVGMNELGTRVVHYSCWREWEVDTSLKWLNGVWLHGSEKTSKKITFQSREVWLLREKQLQCTKHSERNRD